MLQPQIHIPAPCHEAWDEMTPNNQGRYCLQCQQTVVDFSNWETPAILQYLNERKAGSVCGRVQAAQVEAAPEAPAAFIAQLLHSGMNLLQRIAAILLFVLFTGGIALAQHSATKRNTLHPPVMGKMIRQPKPAPQPRKPHHQYTPYTLTGLVAPSPVAHPADSSRARE